MLLRLIRTTFTETSTIGKLYVDNVFECYTLEDKCREYKDTEQFFEVAYEKVVGKTAIPFGEYVVDITWSPRFKKSLPVLINVFGFSGVRIHTGNKSSDTEGCILVGKTIVNNDFIGESVNAFASLMRKLETATNNNEEIIIKIEMGVE